MSALARKHQPFEYDLDDERTPDNWRALPIEEVLTQRLYRTHASVRFEHADLLTFLEANPRRGLVREFDTAKDAKAFTVGLARARSKRLRAVRDDAEVYLSLRNE